MMVMRRRGVPCLILRFGIAVSLEQVLAEQHGSVRNLCLDSGTLLAKEEGCLGFVPSGYNMHARMCVCVCTHNLIVRGRLLRA